MVFFVLVIVVGSSIQGRLEKRKDAQKAAQKLASASAGSTALLRFFTRRLTTASRDAAP